MPINVKIKDELKLNKELDLNLELIVDYSIKNKILIFPPEIEGIDLDFLHAAKILKQNQVDDNLKFAFKFFEKYKENLEIELNEGFSSYTQALVQIEEDFTNEKHVQGFSKLERELWATAIIESNENNGETFVKYIESLNLETHQKELHLFYAGYSGALPWIQIEVDVFCNNAQRLIKWTNEENDYNLPLGRLLNGIRNKIYEDSSFGIRCFKYVLELKDFEVDLLIPIITGLYEKFGIDFYEKHFDKLVLIEPFSTAIFCGLANIGSVSNIEARLFLSIYQKAKNENSEILIHLSKLLFAILNSSDFHDDSHHKESCVKCLEEMLAVDNPNLIRYILRESEYVENQDNALQMLVVKLINQPHFQVKEYLWRIDHIIRNTKEIEFFEHILFALAENWKYKEVAKKLNSSIHEFLGKQKKEFDELLIRLLIQNKPYYRFVGFDIFNSVTPLDGCYIFDSDILSLEPLNQYKLWISILVGYREPKSVIPCLLPLLKSKSQFVKEVFICKLEEYSENYGGGLTDVLRNKLDINGTETKIIYERIEKYMNDYFAVNAKVKNGIKELNPQYTQNKIFKEFNQSYSRKMSRIIKKASDDGSSFLKYITKVQLLKGGGWKMEGRDDISKLADIGPSWSLPRCCFIEPEHFDWEQGKELTRDWDDNYFAEIKNILDDE